MAEKNFEIQIPGREWIRLHLDLDDQQVIQSAHLEGIGGPQFLKTLDQYRSELKGQLAKLPMPKTKDLASLLIRELVLKAQDKWEYPYQDFQLCHCRAVPTASVDAAILTGAHTPKKVSRQTSASTACGTCRPDVESIIEYRLKF